MKRMLALGMTSILIVPVFSSAIVFAEGSSGNSTTSTSQSSTTDANDDTPKTPDQLKALADRIAEHKTELKTKLATAEKLRITTKCTASQGLISSVRGRIKGIETSRSEVYKNLISRLQDVSEKIKNKGIDTTALDADITTLQGKIDTFNTDLAAYKQDVSDLANMDCKADPDGFKASLEAARSALKKVQGDAAAVKGYVNDTVKPLLKTIRDQIEKDGSSTNDNGGNQ